MTLADQPPFQTGHAPFVARDLQVIPWNENVMNLISTLMNYGLASIDGSIFSLKQTENGLYLVFVDGFAKSFRFPYNVAMASGEFEEEDIGTLDQAIRSSRNHDFSYPVSLPLQTGALTAQSSHDLLILTAFANFEAGFVEMNYLRPIAGPSDCTKKGVPADCAIDANLYHTTFSLIPFFWPAILGPKSPTHPGINVLLSQNSHSPHPSVDRIRFKASSEYHTRSRAVREKRLFNARFAGNNPKSEFYLGDVLLLDWAMNYLREASGSNFFVVEQDGTFHTPKADGSIFPGLNRRFVIMDLVNGPVGKAMGWKMADEEEEMSLADLRNYRKKGASVFFTGSALGVVAAKKVIIAKVPRPTSLSDYEILDFTINQHVNRVAR
ncbi:aminotransferase class IV [Candidatus Micrarchaeota archaeon]|nr:aminotransferase class IV [Candidatus Micrarchaeota archaeon]